MSRTLRTAPALALLLLLALLGAAAPASAEYVRDVAPEDVADTIACPAGSTLDRSIVVLDSAYVGLPGPAVGGIAYVRTGINGDDACPTAAAFEVIPPPGAALATDVPVECAIRLTTAPSPCPVDTSRPASYGGTTVLDARSGQAGLFQAPSGPFDRFYIYFPIRVTSPFATFQASSPPTCANAEPCPPAQGNGRVQVAAQFTSNAATSKVLSSSVGLQTTAAQQPTPTTPGTPPTPTSTTPGTPPAPGGSPLPAATTVSVAPSATRSTLRRGLAVRLGGLPTGARVSVRLRARGRTVASASRSRTTGATLSLKLKASSTALRRLGSGRRTATLEVRVTPAGGSTTRTTKRVTVR